MCVCGSFFGQNTYRMYEDVLLSYCTTAVSFDVQMQEHTQFKIFARWEEIHSCSFVFWVDKKNEKLRQWYMHYYRQHYMLSGVSQLTVTVQQSVARSI